MGYDRNWQDVVGGRDALGRAVWALGTGMRFAPRASWRRVCRILFERAFPHLRELTDLRPRAYAVLGLVQALAAGGPESSRWRDALAGEAAVLTAAYAEHRRPGWAWLEETMTYDNARLPEALLRAGEALGDTAIVRAGEECLAFYESVVVEGDLFVPIGNDGWFSRGGKRARYAQQPLEAAALVDAALAARDVLGDPRYEALARTGFEWFLGRNVAGAVMADERGGCRDGIDASGVNDNMGAESTLSYLAAALAFASGGPPLRDGGRPVLGTEPLYVEVSRDDS